MVNNRMVKNRVVKNRMVKNRVVKNRVVSLLFAKFGDHLVDLVRCRLVRAVRQRLSCGVKVIASEKAVKFEILI